MCLPKYILYAYSLAKHGESDMGNASLTILILTVNISHMNDPVVTWQKITGLLISKTLRPRLR